MNIKQVSKLTISLLIAVVGVANAADAPVAKPAVVEASSVTVNATVVDVDQKNRTVTLKNNETGNISTLEVSKDATRFHEVKKNDQVQIDYLESVGVVVQSPDKKVSTAEGSSSVLVRNQGVKPSGVMTSTDVVTATVESVDAKTRKATLKGPTGNMITIDVAPDVAHLENVKKGDQVYVKYTRSVAIDVRKYDYNKDAKKAEPAKGETKTDSKK